MKGSKQFYGNKLNAILANSVLARATLQPVVVILLKLYIRKHQKVAKS